MIGGETKAYGSLYDFPKVTELQSALSKILPTLPFSRNKKGAKWQSLISVNCSLKLKCSSSERKFLFSTFKSFGILHPLCVDCISIRKLFHELCSRSDGPCKPFFVVTYNKILKMDVSFSLVQGNISTKEKKSYYFKN